MDPPAPTRTAAPQANLFAALVRGIAWTGAANVTASLLNALVGLALARLLAPSDFGVQTAVVTVTAFFATVAETGIGSAVLQREDLEPDALSSVFWGVVGGSMLLALLVAAASPWVAQLFHEPAVAVALPVAALSIVAFGASVVPSALLRRRMAFDRLARANVTGAATGVLVGVVVALLGGGYWALIGYGLASSAVAAALQLRSSGWKPSRTFDRRHFARVRSYAGSMTAFVTVNYWSRNLDDLLIGRYLGIAPLGHFSLAQRLVGAPLQLLTGSLSPLLHPTFAAMGDDLPRQRAAYLDLVHATARVTFAGAAIVWVLAEPLVRVVAGEAWLPSVPVVRAMAPLAAVQPVNMLCGAVFMARDAAHRMLQCALVGAAAVTIGMLHGLPHGVAGVAWGYTAAYLLVSAPVATLVALRLLGGRVRQLVSALAGPLAVGGGVLAFELGAARLLDGRLEGARELGALLAVSAIAFGVAVAPTARRIARARARTAS